MPLKTVLKTLDGLTDEVKKLYTEQDDGSFVLDVEGVDDHPSVKNLKSAHEKTKEARKKLAEQIEALNKRIENLPEDFDPEKYAELTEKLAALEAKHGKDKGKGKGEGGEDDEDRVASLTKIHEQKMANLKKQFEKDVAKLQETLTKDRSVIRKVLVEEGLTKALIDNGVGKDFLKAAKAMLAGSAVVEEDEGEYVAKIKTAEGEKVDIAKYVTDWAQSDEGKIFVTPPKGGGAEGSGGGRKGDDSDNPWKDGPTWNLTKQGQLMRADRAKAERLARAAGKSLPA